MFKLVLKAFVLFWPFLKNIVFKDRTVREVLAENRQFTWLFGVLLITLVTLYLTVSTLSDTKQQLATTQQELARLRQGAPPVTVGPQCPPPVVDRERLFQLLTPTPTQEGTP